MRESKTLFSVALGGLVMVNVALAAALYTRVCEPAVYAQAAGGRPDVMAVSTHHGAANGAGLIWMLDSNSGQLVLMRPDVNRATILVLDRRSCALDLDRIGK